MLPALPVQLADVPWPTLNWPVRAPSAAHARALNLLGRPLWESPAALGTTHALVVIQHGQLLYERYAADVTSAQTLPSWSMAKSIVHALCGLLVLDGKLDIDAPLRPREWTGAGDQRAGINTRQLLAMRSGLDFAEDYVDRSSSDVMEMLWGSGKSDVAGYAAMKPAIHGPGAHFNYSSGSTNIVARHLGEIVGTGAAAMQRFMRQRLFDPLGMASATPKFDSVGTFKGSSFCYCTALDFARFGLLYLRDGLWDGRRLLPEHWVSEARTCTYREPVQQHRHYGMHWWINEDDSSFYAGGYAGQRIIVAPMQDAVIVRLGKSTDAQGPVMHEALMKLLAELPRSE